MKIEKESETVAVVTVKGKTYKYRKSTAGFQPKGQDYVFRVWSVEKGNWLSNDELTALKLPSPESVFEKMKKIEVTE